MVSQPVATPCPPTEIVIDRSFYTEPPACIDQRRKTEFRCTPDPARAGYCIETFGALSVEAAQSLSDQLICAQRVAEWLKIERDARAAHGQGGK